MAFRWRSAHTFQRTADNTELIKYRVDRDGIFICYKYNDVIAPSTRRNLVQSDWIKVHLPIRMLPLKPLAHLGCCEIVVPLSLKRDHLLLAESGLGSSLLLTSYAEAGQSLTLVRLLAQFLGLILRCFINTGTSSCKGLGYNLFTFLFLLSLYWWIQKQSETAVWLICHIPTGISNCNSVLFTDGIFKLCLHCPSHLDVCVCARVCLCLSVCIQSLRRAQTAWPFQLLPCCQADPFHSLPG